MNDIATLFEIDWVSVIIAFLAIVVTVPIILKGAEYIAQKLGIELRFTRRRREEHELLVKTSENLAKLQEKHEQDVEESIKYDQVIKEELHAFAKEIKDSIKKNQDRMDDFYANRIHDREQSFQIQRELTDSIKEVADGGRKREEQMNAVMMGSRELLGAEIDRRFDKYLSMNGIPSNEWDEFIALHDAYKRCHGNHSRDAKFEYVTEQLGPIPVKNNVFTNPKSGDPSSEH